MVCDGLRSCLTYWPVLSRVVVIERSPADDVRQKQTNQTKSDMSDRLDKCNFADGGCHDRDNSRLAPSENAREANTGTRERTRASAAPPNRTPASEQATQARSLLVLFFVKSTLALYLLYLDRSLSSRLIGIHMYPSALRPSRLTFYD